MQAPMAPSVGGGCLFYLSYRTVLGIKGLSRHKRVPSRFAGPLPFIPRSP